MADNNPWNNATIEEIKSKAMDFGSVEASATYMAIMMLEMRTYYEGMLAWVLGGQPKASQRRNSWIEILFNDRWTDVEFLKDDKAVPPGSYRARRVSVVVDNELRYDELAFGYTVKAEEVKDQP